MRVYIYACETTYEGLHGLYDCRVCEVNSVEEAHDYGREMSIGVIESYGLEEQYFEEEELEEGDYDIGEYTEWSVFAIDEKKCKNLSTKELDRIASNNDDKTFIQKYCLSEGL